MEPKTHPAIDPALCGTPQHLGEGEATVAFKATEPMRADARGLVHGGFVFGLADYAAMLAVNHPNVVLGSASTRFERPVVVGDTLIARAKLRPAEGKKQIVDVEVTRQDVVVMRGEFTCFSPGRHVLAPKEETE